MPIARDLLTNDYFRVLAEDDTRTVRLVRTAMPFPSNEVIEQTFAALEGATASLPADWALLIDSREGPLRNNPHFERVLARVRGQIFGRFRGVAVLVRSAVGKLQVARYAREDNTESRIFDDEGVARAYLAARLARPTKPPSR